MHEHEQLLCSELVEQEGHLQHWKLQPDSGTALAAELGFFIRSEQFLAAGTRFQIRGKWKLNWVEVAHSIFDQQSSSGQLNR